MNKKSGLVRMVLCKITVLQNGLSSPIKICLTKIFYRKPAALSMGGLCSFLKLFLCICAGKKRSPVFYRAFKEDRLLYTKNHRRDTEINKEGKRVDNRSDKRTCHNGGVKVETFCQNRQRAADELCQNNG